MQVALRLHPDSRCEALEAIVVDVDRAGPRLVLRYRLSGRLDQLVLPPAGEPARTDDLWRHTCFEAFAAGEGSGYREFNFAPSRRWAAYDFDAYRQGMRPAPARALNLEVERSADGLELLADVEAPRTPIRLGLSAVIEEANGRISYWALAHPPGRPDFHAPDCFALELPAVEPS
jgi:hypothetical protein